MDQKEGQQKREPLLRIAYGVFEENKSSPYKGPLTTSLLGYDSVDRRTGHGNDMGDDDPIDD